MCDHVQEHARVCVVLHIYPVMVEGLAREIPEETLCEAVLFAHQEVLVLLQCNCVCVTLCCIDPATASHSNQTKEGEREGPTTFEPSTTFS